MVLGVSQSAYYTRRNRQPSRRQKENEELITQLEKVFEQSRQTYGSHRLHADLGPKRDKLFSPLGSPADVQQRLVL